MRDPSRWSKAVGVVGGVSLVIGSFDPMEGSVLILPGTALLALGSYLDHDDRRTVAYRTWSFVLVALGVGALFGLSALGGVGGTSGRSGWWALLILPYLIGWSIDLWGPGASRWLSVGGIAVGTWYLAIVGVLLWRSGVTGRVWPLTAAIAIATVGVGTIIASALRLRKLDSLD